jgi:hypothetical protein
MRLRVWRNSGETQQIKTAGWFMGGYLPKRRVMMKYTARIGWTLL